MNRYVKRLRWYLSREFSWSGCGSPFGGGFAGFASWESSATTGRRLCMMMGAAYREALGRIKNELGVPSDDSPAPVANAWYIADAALNSHRFAAGDEEHASNVVAVAEPE